MQGHSADCLFCLPVLDTCRANANPGTGREALLAARSIAIQNLHGLLVIPDAHISDNTLAAVVRLVLSDLCAGETDELRVHSDGIRDMTGFRGGLAALGMEGGLAKMVLM